MTLAAISDHDRSHIEHVLESLPGAWKIVRLAHKAYAREKMDASLIGCIMDVRDDMAQYLVLFRDTFWIGWADADDLRFMTRIEAAASSLLEACVDAGAQIRAQHRPCARDR